MMSLKLDTTINSHKVLGLRQWLLIVIVLFVVIPSVVIGLNYDQCYLFYFRNIVAPKLTIQFGFTPGKTLLIFGKESQEIFMLSAVDPNGVLGKKGVRSGDIPTTWGEHKLFIRGNENVFYYKLMQVQKGETVKIGFIIEPDLQKYYGGNVVERKIVFEGIRK